MTDAPGHPDSPHTGTDQPRPDPEPPRRVVRVDPEALARLLAQHGEAIARLAARREEGAGGDDGRIEPISSEQA